MNTVVVGAQWGDEGKGKLIDIMSKDADITVRFQGGSNAGHTVIVGKEEYVFHLLPSAILRQDKVCVIGNGVVVDPKALLEEIDGLSKRGISVTPKQLKIATNCHVVMPYHRILDALRETKRKNKIGTTGRGIGPCYADKVARCGIRMVDLLNPEVLYSRLADNLAEKNDVFETVYGHEAYDLETVYKEYSAYGERLKDYVCDTALYLNSEIKAGKEILFEGAQGVFLDIDFGTYPFVTSSNTIVGGVCPGCGVSPVYIDRVIAAVKAYTTRVGEGPFPTEFKDEMGDLIQKKGHEFGATTGRPRRCGWFDAVQVRYAVIINGISELAVMKLDVLSGLEKIGVCTSYRYKGQILDTFPHDFDAVQHLEPVYEYMPGWQEDLSGVRAYDDLPLAARDYIAFLESKVGVKMAYISIGSERDQFIVR